MSRSAVDQYCDLAHKYEPLSDAEELNLGQ